jgi:hypothetical protein
MFGYVAHYLSGLRRSLMEVRDETDGDTTGEPDDATNEHYSMFFVDEEGTAGSFQGVRDVIVQRGLFSSLYTDRGSHYWYTPKEGGKVGKTELTQFGRAMKHLGIQMIPAYSPEARGRSERAFETLRTGLSRSWLFMESQA